MNPSPEQLAAQTLRASDRIDARASNAGCIFSARCPRRIGAICDEQAPPFAEAGSGHRIRCHIPVVELRTLQAAANTSRANV